MWRSLFYSAGIGLFALGLQTLVVEHVTVPKNTKFQKLVRKVFSDDNKPQFAVNQTGQPQLTGLPGNQFGQNFTGQAQAPFQRSVANQSFGTNTGSRFGPSRFAGPAYGTGYGGQRVNSASTGGASQFNAPQFGGSQQFQNRTNAQLTGFSTGPAGPVTNNLPQMQKFVIKEWMPWSLLASGALIFLYTHSHQRRRHGE